MILCKIIGDRPTEKSKYTVARKTIPGLFMLICRLSKRLGLLLYVLKCPFPAHFHTVPTLISKVPVRQRYLTRGNKMEDLTIYHIKQ